ncbi:MAG: Type secretion outerrane pore forming protein YscC [Paucimonas sp.]|nr:Type secretion outerrane pore forming protein YscC [Paucimonas sp.]
MQRLWNAVRRRWLLAARCACVLAFAGMGQASVHAAVPPWPESSFTYIAANQKLPDVLGRLARTFGIDLQMTPAVRASNVVVNGRITTATPSEFLNQLGGAYGLSWYYQNGTLFISRSSEQSTQAVVPPGFSPGALRKALTELGVVETKFGWGEVPDRGIVLVSGPATYVNMVAKTVADLPAAPPDQQLHVFKLRHASAEDRVVTYRDKQITTLGVANILRSIIGANLPRQVAGSTSTQLMELAAPLRSQYAGRPDAASMPPPPGAGMPPGMPPGARPDVVGSPYGAPSLSSLSNVPLRGVIQTDTRLNAIIVKDKPENVAVYRQLIELLDVPSELIEIEAMIVDVNLQKITDLGIDWSVRRGNVGAALGAGGAVAAFASGGASAVIGNAASSLLARIRALEGEGSARVVSRPSILTIDNLGALIDLSETFYIQTPGSTTDIGPGVTAVSVGVTLKVTPRVIADSSGGKAVQLVVDIEDGAIQDYRVGILPTVRRTTIGTQAVIGERESLLVGGFNATRERSSRDGVPGLSNVPLLGGLFSRQTNIDERMERLFLITPRIVASPVR